MNSTITSGDWHRSITASRKAPNAILQRWISRWAFVGLVLSPGDANAAPVREPLEIARMVEVLRQLEGGPPENPWQFTEATWHHYSKQPMKSAPPAEHRRVAWMFVGECCRQCASLDLQITPYNTAALWHAGFGAVRDHKVTAKQKDFAQRASNLYNEKP